MVALVRFHQKAHRKRTGKKNKRVDDMTITNNGSITFPYAEAQELGIKSTQTFSRVIHELVEDKGFIDISEPGNWYLRQPTRYAISQRWKRYGTALYKAVHLDRQLPKGMGFQCQENKTRFDRSQSTGFDASQ